MRSLLSLLTIPAVALAVPAPAPVQLPFLGSSPTTATSKALQLQLQHARPVHVQLGVMSRCPDAQLCEAVWDRVLEAKVQLEGRGTVEVGELVRMDMVYIARENSTAPYGGVQCMHGDLECRGNVQQLCAAKHWATASGEREGEIAEMVGGLKEKQGYEEWWNFVQCLNYGDTSEIGTDKKARECARVVKRDYSPTLSTCIGPASHPGAEGRALLLASLREAEKLDVRKSCTVLIEGRQVCIHDSTWKSCPIGHEVADFAKAVKDEFFRLNPHFAPVPEIDAEETPLIEAEDEMAIRSAAPNLPSPPQPFAQQHPQLQTGPLLEIRWVLNHSNYSEREIGLQCVTIQLHAAFKTYLQNYADYPYCYSSRGVSRDGREVVKRHYKDTNLSNKTAKLTEQHRPLLEHVVNTGGLRSNFFKLIDDAFETPDSKKPRMAHCLAFAAFGIGANSCWRGYQPHQPLLFELLYTRLRSLTPNDKQYKRVTVDYLGRDYLTARLGIDEDQLEEIRKDPGMYNCLLTLVWASMVEAGTYTHPLKSFMMNTGTAFRRYTNRDLDGKKRSPWRQADQLWLAALLKLQYARGASHVSLAVTALLTLSSDPVSPAGRRLSDELAFRTAAAITLELNSNQHHSLYVLRFIRLSNIGIDDSTSFDEALAILFSSKDEDKKEQLCDLLDERDELAESDSDDEDMTPMMPTPTTATLPKDDGGYKQLLKQNARTMVDASEIDEELQELRAEVEHAEADHVEELVEDNKDAHSAYSQTSRSSKSTKKHKAPVFAPAATLYSHRHDPQPASSDLDPTWSHLSDEDSEDE
ncbi:hypothetical protein JCM10213_003049 [Rhodosporidiobolus nylandii]